MTLSYLLATALNKTVWTVVVKLSNIHLDKRLMMFSWNLGMRKE